MTLATGALAPAPTDAEAITAVLAGDQAQFALLVRRHNQVLFRACRAVLHDDGEAEDAVQTAWLSAYRALRTFRGDAQFRTWITRIAIHEASRMRARLRLTTLSTGDRMATTSSDPARDLSDQELGRMLEHEIDGLPEGMRHVLVLRDVIELDTAETAHCLGIGEEAVRVRLHRARQALARSIAGVTPGAALERATAHVWPFAGERCARVLSRVMAELAAVQQRGRP